MALQLVDIVLTDDLNGGEDKKMHRLKGELLGFLGDNEPSFSAKNILHNGHHIKMELAGKAE